MRSVKIALAVALALVAVAIGAVLEHSPPTVVGANLSKLLSTVSGQWSLRPPRCETARAELSFATSERAEHRGN